MTSIPNDTMWYLADLVVRITVEGDPRNVVHVNTVLVQAISAEDAYAKALVLGKEQVGEPYLNPNGKQVESEFIGLKDLAVIHDNLEHGAELFFTERTNVSSDEIFAMVNSKSGLSVFADVAQSTGPDYSSGPISQDYEIARKNSHS
jgi:hypothetical protein